MATKKIQITIPEYLSVDKFQQLQNLEHLTELGKAVKTISIITGLNEEEILDWQPTDLRMIYDDVIKCMDGAESFYPIFEAPNGTLYGYSNINEMKLSEYMDLEKLCKNPTENLHEIMAVLYRPIKKHQLKDLTWVVKHKFKIHQRKVGNIFKYYTLEKYNSHDRESNAELLKGMPVQFALGALGFFLGTGSGYLNLISPYSSEEERKELEMTDKTILNLLVSIGGGLRQFIHSRKQIFSISQEKRVSLT
jgi:hypothetical protein